MLMSFKVLLDVNTPTRKIIPPLVIKIKQISILVGSIQRSGFFVSYIANAMVFICGYFFW